MAKQTKTNKKTTATGVPAGGGLGDLINFLNSGGFTSGSQVIGGSRFPALEGMSGGLWNEASGQVENYDQPYTRPLYVNGDEWKELPTDGAELANLQHQLITAGYMDDKNIVFGSPDPKTASAMAELLGSSNATGKIWSKTLAERLAAAGQQPSTVKAARRDPLVINLDNPDDIRAMVQSGANQIFGKFLDPAEVEKFVSSYQSQQANYQTAAYQASGFDPSTGQAVGPLDEQGRPQGRGTTLTAPATGAGAQEEFFRQMNATHPTATSAAIFTDQIGQMLQSLKGSPIGIRP